MENSATLDDIPDEELQKAYKAKILEIMTNIYGPEDAEVLAPRLHSEPLPAIQQFIELGNTPEYVENHGESLYSGLSAGSLDTHMLSMGRPAGDLEEPSMQCDVLKSMFMTAESLEQAFGNNPNLLSSLEDSLNASFSPLIQLYKCGNIDAFVESVSEGTMKLDDNTGDVILTERNKNMAAKIDGILKANPEERIMFVVGANHWIVGEDSLEMLLKDLGYTLEHLPEWTEDDVENHSHEHCKVIYNPETGLFHSSQDKGEYSNVPDNPIFLNTTAQPTRAPSSGAETLGPGLSPLNVTMSPTVSPMKKPSDGGAVEVPSPDPGTGTQPSGGLMNRATRVSAFFVGGAFMYLWSCA